MPRSKHSKNPKTAVSMKMTCTGPESATMAFTFTTTGNTTPQQVNEMREVSRKMADTILANTPHKIQEVAVEEVKMKKEDTPEPPTTPAAKPKMSPELQKMVDEMYKSLDNHTYVFTRAPKAGEVAIPTGGLAKCECSPECTKVYPQPAYEILKVEKGGRWKLDEAQNDRLGVVLKQNKNKGKNSPARKISVHL